MEQARARVAVIFGNRGCLGKCVETKLKESGWTCWGVSPRTLARVSQYQVNSVEHLPKDIAVDAVICCAGAFETNSSDCSNVDPEQLPRLWNANVVPAFDAAALASKHHSKTLVLCGALAAYEQKTSFAITYGACKAAVHHMAVSYQQHNTHCHVHCLLPGILDTPTNRQSMPGEDFTKWTLPSFVASKMLELCEADAKVSTLDHVFIRL